MSKDVAKGTFSQQVRAGFQQSLQSKSGPELLLLIAVNIMRIALNIVTLTRQRNLL